MFLAFVFLFFSRSTVLVSPFIDVCIIPPVTQVLNQLHRSIYLFLYDFFITFQNTRQSIYNIHFPLQNFPVSEQNPFEVNIIVSYLPHIYKSYFSANTIYSDDTTGSKRGYTFCYHSVLYYIVYLPNK